MIFTFCEIQNVLLERNSKAVKAVFKNIGNPKLQKLLFTAWQVCIFRYSVMVHEWSKTTHTKIAECEIIALQRVLSLKRRNDAPAPQIVPDQRSGVLRLHYTTALSGDWTDPYWAFQHQGLPSKNVLKAPQFYTSN